MFDIGWTELLVIGIVALIVVGPQDLPKLFRTLGKVTGRLRAMASDFQRTLEQAADEAGVKEMASDLRKATDASKFGLDDIEKSAEELLAEDEDDEGIVQGGAKADEPWKPDPSSPGPEVAKPVTLPPEKLAEAKGAGSEMPSEPAPAKKSG